MLLTLNRHVTWWRLFSWVLTLVGTFVRFWHCQEVQLLSGIILDKFVIVVKSHTGEVFFYSQVAAKTNESSLFHRIIRDHHERTWIKIWKTVRIYCFNWISWCRLSEKKQKQKTLICNNNNRFHKCLVAWRCDMWPGLFNNYSIKIIISK